MPHFKLQAGWFLTKCAVWTTFTAHLVPSNYLSQLFSRYMWRGGHRNTTATGTAAAAARGGCTTTAAGGGAEGSNSSNSGSSSSDIGSGTSSG